MGKGARAPGQQDAAWGPLSEISRLHLDHVVERLVADRLLGHDNLRLLHVNLLRQQADEYRVLLLFVDRQ